MKNLPTLEELHQVAKKHAKRALHDDSNMMWIFFDERGRSISISDEYSFLPEEEKREVLNGFLHWLNE
ncbi:hypothetical protein H5S11_05565 [Limosilactobacillus sp. pH52_RY]|uniref:hypothetical protein n=1 Tax=Limosilactobacillus balticus TaxID=2759747 RepID=UPI0015F85663|nr:hypothetical protein [Limosilactobacillus balticus]MBB1109931.1 hypothetical protein [Limosilactobacillus balticus]